ncbi:MAG: ExbD/TolR family protein [Betaproteobacteria bacterium]|nr:ExbD/TolR family protein [Betaproteobacteria bacterium]
MSPRRPRRAINQINVVPYIDVMLVLLIIFMVTAPLINPGEIELPSVGQNLTSPVAPLEITIKLDRSVVLRDRAGSGEAQRVSREALLAAVRAKQDKRPEQAVVIAADKGVRYEDVVAVLDLLQRNQVRKVGLLARSST